MLLQSKIPIATRRPRSGAQSGSRIYQFVGGGGLAEFDVELGFAKIQNSHLWGGGGLAEFDVEFRFAKIQNSYLWGWGGGWQNLMLSSDLLKSKIPICGAGGGGWCCPGIHAANVFCSLSLFSVLSLKIFFTAIYKYSQMYVLHLHVVYFSNK